MENLVNTKTMCKVSSVLNRNNKDYGKKNMFDGTVDSCWNSDQGCPQYVRIKFGSAVNISRLELMFQGGFVGKECRVEAVSESGSAFLPITTIYPEDINRLQTFDVPVAHASELRLIFEQSTDFFGRVTIYQLRVMGERLGTCAEGEESDESDDDDLDE
eukprot:TRINITY_DN6547_c0_g1_i1.p1 TRINITY_DN6547_c0_g1~~TRINITY_DN6547_c0_g1_i1.p1  ORF type:complete len:159 (-),score=49.57 TRINITY_DN6547_c0_g1_i1:92-568(-)